MQDYHQFLQKLNLKRINMNKQLLIRKILVYVLLVLLFASFQVSFPDFLMFHGQIADLMFVFVILASYMFGFRDGAVLALFVGLLRDYFANPIISGIDGAIIEVYGLGVLVLFVCGAVSSSFFTHRLHRNWAFAFVSVLFCTLLYKAVGHISIFVWTRFVLHQIYSLDYSQAIVDSILPQIFLNLLVAIPIYLILKFIGPYKKGINPSLTEEREVTLLG